MSHSSRIGVIGFGIVCGALVLVACSSPPDLSQTKSQDETAAAGSNGPGSSSNPSKTPASNPSNPTTPTSPTTPPAGTDAGGSPGTDQACAAMTAADACTTCCDTAHAAGATVYQDASDACMCGAAGKCQTECAKTDCSADDNSPSSVTGDACDLCEKANDPDTGVGGCTAPIQAACTGSPDCVALQKCYDACP